MCGLILALCLTLNMQLNVFQEGGIQKIYLEDKPTFITVSAEFNNNAWMDDMAKTIEHEDVINIVPQKIMLGGEYQWSSSKKDAYRCKINFLYKFDDEKHYLMIEHLHDVFSEDALLGVLYIEYDGKKLKIPLKTNRKPFYLLKVGEIPDEFKPFGYRDSSKNAFEIGMDLNDTINTPYSFRLPSQKIGKNRKVKVEFDYWNSKNTNIPTVFLSSTQNYPNQIPGLSLTYSSVKNICDKKLKIYKDGMFHHFKTILHTEDTEDIDFMWKTEILPQHTNDYFNTTIIDNVKFEVLDNPKGP